VTLHIQYPSWDTGFGFPYHEKDCWGSKCGIGSTVQGTTISYYRIPRTICYYSRCCGTLL
jgi:hypothetical protein